MCETSDLLKLGFSTKSEYIKFLSEKYGFSFEFVQIAYEAYILDDSFENLMKALSLYSGFDSENENPIKIQTSGLYGTFGGTEIVREFEQFELDDCELKATDLETTEPAVLYKYDSEKSEQKSEE